MQKWGNRKCVNHLWSTCGEKSHEFCTICVLGSRGIIMQETNYNFHISFFFFFASNTNRLNVLELIWSHLLKSLISVADGWNYGLWLNYLQLRLKLWVLGFWQSSKRVYHLKDLRIINSLKESLPSQAAVTWPLFPGLTRDRTESSKIQFQIRIQANKLITWRRWGNIQIFAVIHANSESNYVVAHVTAIYTISM